MKLSPMPIRPVVLFGDPRLRVKATEVDLRGADWRSDADDLWDTLEDRQQRLGFGRALAAPQIGSSRRLIAFNCAIGRFVAVNPRITWHSNEQLAIWDDCFSLPGTCVAVARYRSVSFECFDLEGNSKAFNRLDPSHSELVQHEIDHLEGILMVDRLIEPTAIIASEMAATTPLPLL